MRLILLVYLISLSAHGVRKCPDVLNFGTLEASFVANRGKQCSGIACLMGAIQYARAQMDLPLLEDTRAESKRIQDQEMAHGVDTLFSVRPEVFFAGSPTCFWSPRDSSEGFGHFDPQEAKDVQND